MNDDSPVELQVAHAPSASATLGVDLVHEGSGTPTATSVG